MLDHHIHIAKYRLRVCEVDAHVRSREVQHFVETSVYRDVAIGDAALWVNAAHKHQCWISDYHFHNQTAHLAMRSDNRHANA